MVGHVLTRSNVTVRLDSIHLAAEQTGEDEVESMVCVAQRRRAQKD